MDYYKAPKQEIFEEIKSKAIKLWKTFDDTYGYATGKIDRIKDFKNIEDNAWTIVAMFDKNNQKRLLGMVNKETKNKLNELFNYAYNTEFGIKN